ncbi:hypothetical protein ACWAVC_001879 [Campylobacter jejuni]|uniref:hypothetical protein n=1 Tax=Campylobacter jejuni TaxID=197 RepID=UPI00155DB893|nr:hypothetical protein [Campylobacter jejuni]HEG1361716.1 hypothetical protein [Campylobacter jejuni]HEG5822951.1 hypothetical protein [Campylobacter jejuni]HEG6167827.1 hypothetical protein [Campylobacter jejuni]HEG6383730.1 hypothetical protein [Campylobacter jejuni]
MKLNLIPQQLGCCVVLWICKKGEGSRAFYMIGECTNMSLEELDNLSLEDITLLSNELNNYQTPSGSTE